MDQAMQGCWESRDLDPLILNQEEAYRTFMLNLLESDHAKYGDEDTRKIKVIKANEGD